MRPHRGNLRTRRRQNSTVTRSALPRLSHILVHIVTRAPAEETTMHPDPDRHAQAIDRAGVGGPR